MASPVSPIELQNLRSSSRVEELDETDSASSRTGSVASSILSAASSRASSVGGSVISSASSSRNSSPANLPVTPVAGNPAVSPVTPPVAGNPAGLPTPPIAQKWEGNVTIERLADLVSDNGITAFRFNVTIGQTSCFIPVYPKFPTIENATLILNQLIATCCGHGEENLSVAEDRFKEIKTSLDAGGILAIKKEEQEDKSLFKKQKKDPIYGVYRLAQDGIFLTNRADVIGMIAVTDEAMRKIAALLASMRGSSQDHTEGAFRLRRIDRTPVGNDPANHAAGNSGANSPNNGP